MSPFHFISVRDCPPTTIFLFVYWVADVKLIEQIESKTLWGEQINLKFLKSPLIHPPLASHVRFTFIRTLSAIQMCYDNWVVPNLPIIWTKMRIPDFICFVEFLFCVYCCRFWIVSSSLFFACHDKCCVASSNMGRLCLLW